MRALLVILIAFMTLSSVFNWDPGPAPGLKVQNALVYLLMMGLTFRVATERSFRLELPAVHGAFAVLIGYAILTYAAIVFVIEYQHYDALRNGFLLKNLVDHLLFFVVFFYSLRSRAELVTVLKCLLAVIALSHVMALLDAQGVVSFGDIERRDDGRVQGLLGESNQYGAFVAMSLPAVISLTFVTRGIERAFWLLASIITAVTLILTVSRGAFVATFVAGTIVMLMFRRYAPPGRLVVIMSAAVVAVIAVAAVAVTLGYGQLVYERMAGSGGDIGSASSGRTEIWGAALERMAEQPISFLTGFGWRAYWSMPFHLSPHNYYLNQWFNLGLVGLACSILLFVLPIRIARRAWVHAPRDTRPILLGFIMASIALAVASFFVELFQPWLYYWAYAGITMRLAVGAQEPATEAVTATPPRAASVADSYGWTGAVRR